jgi:hypothetical protein
MTWRLHFYNERRGREARYGVESPTAAAAVERGWELLRSEHPPGGTKRPVGLFALAQRAGGQEPDGWVLYRIVGTSSAA